MANLKEMMLHSPTYFCAIARADWISDLKAENEDALAGTIDAAAGISIGTVAAIFNHPEASASDLASIMDNKNLSVAKAASIMDNKNLSVAKAASIADDENLTKAKLQSILDDTNLTIQKGQEIVDAMSDPTKIGTGGRRGYLADDWEDNKLTTRDKAATLATTFDKIFSYFRPEWTVVQGSPSVSDGTLDMSSDGTTGDKIRCPSTITEGAWQIDYQRVTYPAGSWTLLKFMFIDDNNLYILKIAADTFYYELHKVVNGTATGLLSVDLAEDDNWHTLKVTRDASGNFEVFFDGVSQGTATDTDITSSNYIELHLADDASFEVHLDNLEVY